MSADNGYVIQKTADGKYTLQTFFGSSETFPSADDCPEWQLFDTLPEAVAEYRKVDGADGYWSEYGLRFNLPLTDALNNAMDLAEAFETPLPEKTFYDKLREIVETCSRCGKLEYTIESSSLEGRKTHYSLITCPQPSCEDHCHCGV